jgi:hypothetical protein
MKNEDLKILEIKDKIKKLENELETIHKNFDFPYLDIFKKSTDAGEDVEKLSCCIIFEDLNRVTNKNYDQKTSGKGYVVETKLIRMMVKGDGGYDERAVSILEKNIGYKQKSKKYGGNISTSTFQQVKPKKFEYLLGIVLFKDGFDIFILPSKIISQTVKNKENGKAYLTGQHYGNNEEGQLHYNDVILNKHYLLSIYNDGKTLYHYNRENKTVGEIFTKLKFENIVNEKFSI